MTFSNFEIYTEYEINIFNLISKLYKIKILINNEK